MITGEMSLRLINTQGRMIFEKSYVQGAFKLGKPLWRNGVPLYYLLHVGGGYVSGDEYRQQIELLDHTALYLTTQAATKVYKGQKPAIVSTAIKIGKESHLSFFQDPLILYENAMFHQITEVELEASSTFYYSEIVTPGWSKESKPFQYKEFYSDFTIKRDGQIFYIDRLYWGNGVQTAMLQLERYTHYGTYLCIEVLPNDFLEMLYEKKVTDCQIGISKLNGHGFVMKVVAKNTQLIESIFQEVDSLLRERKCEQPLLLRKY